MFGLQNAMLIGRTPRPKNPILRHKNRKYASRLLSFVAHIISRVPRHIVTKFQRLYTCFRGKCSAMLSTMSPEVALYRINPKTVGILFLAVLCAEILLLPVWAAAISISGTTRLPVTSYGGSPNRK